MSYTVLCADTVRTAKNYADKIKNEQNNLK